MKVCVLCKQYKPLTEYNKHKHMEDGLQTVCRECNRQRSRQYYAENKEKHKAVTMARKKAVVSENYARIKAIKEDSGCQDCGIRDARVLDFDHVRGTKDRNVSELVSRGVSWKKIQEEINKCEVVCANCHRIRTWERLNAGITQWSE